MESDELYRLFGRDTAAGKALFNIYKKKITVPVPKPRQKTAEQIENDRLAARPKLKPKPEIRVPKCGIKHEAPVKELPMRRKPLTAIRAESNDYEPEQYRPSGIVSKKNLAHEKERLQAAMEKYGAEGSPASTARTQPAPSRVNEDVPYKEQLYDQLIAEIEERHRFLEEMEALGQRKQYEAQVKAEISQRLAELRKLELS